METTKRKLFCVLHHHREGVTVYHVLAQHQEDAERIVMHILKEAGTLFELEAEEESLECFGDLELDYPKTHELIVQKKPINQGGQ